MPRDRLNELLESAKIKSVAEEDEVSITTPLKSRKAHKPSRPLDDIFKEVDRVRENISSIERKVAEVKRLHACIISSPNVEESSRNALDENMNEIRSLSQAVNEELKELNRKVKEDEKANEEQEKIGGGDVHQADLRIKFLQHSTLMETFRKVMADYSECQIKYQDQMKSRLKRTLKIANTHMTDEEIDKALEENIDIQIFAQQYLESTEKAKLDLREIEERHQDLLKLEQSIQEVRKLFVDIALLVQEQGEKIDRIDHHVMLAKDYVESAVKQTEKALISHQRYQKRKLCLVGCISVAVLIIVLAITLSVVFR